jgi:hypothetical protein
MSFDFDFISAADKPALMAISVPEWQTQVLAVLDSLQYKVHTAQDADDFTNKFLAAQYQLVLMDDLFDCPVPSQNRALAFLQNLPMGLRRHAAVILLGHSFQSMNAMQAFAKSVHAVVNGSDLASLDKIISTVTGETDTFLNLFRQVQTRIAQGGL